MAEPDELISHANDIFERDAAYDRCFNQRTLCSIILLTFLQNLMNIVPLVLKRDAGLDWSASRVKANRVSRHVLCLLMRYLAKNRRKDVLVEFGQQLWAKSMEWGEEVAKHLDNYHSGIKAQIKDKFMSIEEANAENINSAFRRIAAALHLGDQIDIFETFKSIDDEADAAES